MVSPRALAPPARRSRAGGPLAVLAAVVGVALLAAPAPAVAWGSVAHGWILAGAVDWVEDAKLRADLEPWRDLLAEHSVDADAWKRARRSERPEHYVDIDAVGLYPFAELPPTRAGLLERYGEEEAFSIGYLPWSVPETADSLAAALRAKRFDRWATFAAQVGHYVSDATQPLHATENFDGQLTGAKGVHHRFEDRMMRRHYDPARGRRGALGSPPALPPAKDLTAFTLVLVRESWVGVLPILIADGRATAADTTRGDAYDDAMWEELRPLAEARMARAMQATAAVWTEAWRRAGRPRIPAPTGREDWSDPKAAREGAGE